MINQRLEVRFVTSVPRVLEPSVLYISMEYGTAVHGCFCGCGEQVVTPFSPNGWKMVFDGESVTIRPSIGNWNFRCRSHYFITESQAVEILPEKAQIHQRLENVVSSEPSALPKEIIKGDVFGKIVKKIKRRLLGS